MNRKLFAILLTCVILSFLVGCNSEPIQVNVSNSEKLYSDNIGTFVKINGELRYDSATRIVYIYNSNSYGSSYTPYYAPNGLPYKYNPETNTFEEIDSK